jgi:hypothetical protein
MKNPVLPDGQNNLQICYTVLIETQPRAVPIGHDSLLKSARVQPPLVFRRFVFLPLVTIVPA